MLAAIRHEMADATTGLYMISAICGLLDDRLLPGAGRRVRRDDDGQPAADGLRSGCGTPLGDSVRYGTAILSFVAGALLGGRLLRGPQKLRERRIGFAVEWVVLLASIVFSLAMIPLLFGDHRSK